MSSSFSSLRQQIDNFQALLTAAASSNNVRNYDIRHCLRQIQSCLLSEQGDLLYDQNENDEVTQVLMTLLILNDQYADPMILEMVNSITQRAAELVFCYGRELSAQQIQELLPRVLCLLQTSKMEEVVHCLLQLLNQHSSPSCLQEVFDGNDQDCWITLQAVLINQQNHRSEPTSFLSLSVFIVTLLNHLATNVLPTQKITLPDWIQSQFLLQHENTSPMEAKQIVGEYMDLLEQFGVYLFELSLHLLEQTAHGEIGSDDNDHNQMDINSLMMTLQYATVATDCVQLCTPRDDGNPPLLAMSFGGILTSLWQALTCFVVQKLESIIPTNNNNGQEDTEGLQIAATETLWQLTQIATSNDVVVLEESSSSMVVVTILRMLKYPETFWTIQTKEWLKGQVTNTPYKVSLRRALQATTLSQVYHRSGSSNAQDHIASLLHEVLNSGNDENQNDPWQHLVEELLSEHLDLVQDSPAHYNQI